MKRITGTHYAYAYKDNTVKNVPLDRTLDKLEQENAARLDKLDAAIRELKSKLKEG